MKRYLFTLFLGLFVSIQCFSQNVVVINEFMASNDSSVTDQDGEYDDWIELYNNSSVAVDLTGYFLSDNPENLPKWDFPTGTTIEGNGYLIVWADEDGMQEGLHANFKLARAGEVVYLLNPDTVIIDQIEFGEQITDQSFAREPNGTGSFVIKAPTFNQNNDVLTAIDAFLPLELHVYPNPATSFLSLTGKLPQGLVTNIRLLDLHGKVLLEKPISRPGETFENQLDLKDFTAGLYLVQILSDQQSLTKRILIRH